MLGRPAGSSSGVGALLWQAASTLATPCQGGSMLPRNLVSRRPAWRACHWNAAVKRSADAPTAVRNRRLTHPISRLPPCRRRARR